MGKQTNIRLRGTVKNIIYYQWKGIDCIRTVPARVRQTAPTKQVAKNFGVAVRNAAVARSLFRKILHVLPPGRALIHITDGAFRKWLHTNPLDEKAEADGISFFNGLSFNEESNFDKIIQAKVSVNRGLNGEVLIQWPECNPVNDVKAPTGTAHIVIKYLAATIDMQQPGVYHATETEYSFPYKNEAIPAKEMILENVTAPGNLALVAMAIWYYKDDTQSKPINILRWKPSGIIASFYN